MPALERVPELQVLYVGIHASASQIDIQRNALIGETAIEAETEDGVIVERITNGPLIEVVDDAIAVGILVDEIAGQQRGITLPIVIDGIVFYFFHRFELADDLIAETDARPPVFCGVTVFIP